MRTALDLINNDFRSGSLETVDMHLNGASERINGLLIWDGVQDESDTLYLLKIVRDSRYLTRSRRSTFFEGDTIVNLDAFGDTMRTLTDFIRLDDATPLLNYAGANGIVTTNLSNVPMVAYILGPDLVQYPVVNIVGSYYVRDIDNHMTTVPEIFFITDIDSGSGTNPDVLTQTTVSRWNSTDGLIRRYGYFGYAPSLDSPIEPGRVPTSGTSDIIVGPVELIGWFVRFDETVQRYRLMRVEDGREDVVADDVRDFQITPPDNTSDVFKIKFEVWVPRFGSDPLSENPVDFIVKADSLKVYR
ncbi:MAG: hypothetical protein GY869_19880 [Planctomycetes bacterium]|nr:hypothetical protein [Planctomycetota bacterium]